MAAKRKRHDERDVAETEAKLEIREKQRRPLTNGEADVDAGSDTNEEVATPSKPRRGRPPGSSQKPRHFPNGVRSTTNLENSSKPERRLLFSSSRKSSSNGKAVNGAPIVRNADRSARRKSARNLIRPTATGGLSEEESLAEEDLLTRQIWEADEAESGAEQDEAGDGPLAEPATPSKSKRSARKQSPTLSPGQPPHEQYFWQNRPGRIKASSNPISSLSLLTHEQYYNQISAYQDPHEPSYEYLHAIHSRAFPQWNLELSQSFNICLYGYGSKRKLVTAFAHYIVSLSPANPPKILIVNGFNQILTPRSLLTNVAALIFGCTISTLPSKLGSQPREILANIIERLRSRKPSTDLPYYIFINSLDAPSLRRSDVPSLLAQLAACPEIQLLATCDTLTFPLLWSTAICDQYNFIFHDSTTYLSFGGLEIHSVIDVVNDLLGRSGRSIKGREGVGFVLRSLPENARNLYRLLIVELLAAMDDDNVVGGGEGGVEYGVLYQKVVEEFICSNDMGFRQLLKEFHDHQMILSKRDVTGAELLMVPWRREEMEGILEDLE